MYGGKWDTVARQTVLNDSGSEKKQPENPYSQTLQSYMGFRGIRDGSVWGVKAHRFLTAPELEMTMHHMMTTFNSPVVGELWLNIHDNRYSKKLLTKTEWTKWMKFVVGKDTKCLKRLQYKY